MFMCLFSTAKEISKPPDKVAKTPITGCRIAKNGLPPTRREATAGGRIYIQQGNARKTKKNTHSILLITNTLQRKQKQSVKKATL